MAPIQLKFMFLIGLTKADHLIASSPPQDAKFLEAFEVKICIQKLQQKSVCTFIIYTNFQQRVGGKITNDNTDVVRNSDILILAVKPFAVTSVLDSIKKSFTNNHLIISIAMGVRIQSIEQVGVFVLFNLSLSADAIDFLTPHSSFRNDK